MAKVTLLAGEDVREWRRKCMVHVDSIFSHGFYSRGISDTFNVNPWTIGKNTCPSIAMFACTWTVCAPCITRRGPSACYESWSSVVNKK